MVQVFWVLLIYLVEKVSEAGVPLLWQADVYRPGLPSKSKTPCH